VHVVALNQSPVTYFVNSDVRSAPVSEPGYTHLIQFIASSFATDSSGGVIPEKRGIYGDSQFYSGNGVYQIFNTCNKWTAKALRSAGYDIDPALKLTASSVMTSLAAACETDE